MNKERILSTALAGLLMFNILGCVSSDNTIDSTSSTGIEELENENELKPKYCVYGFDDYEPEAFYSVKIEDKFYTVLEKNKDRYKILKDEEALMAANEYLNIINNEMVIKEVEDYKITILNLDKFYNENGEMVYEPPRGFVIYDNKAYKVEQKLTTTYNASVRILEDGTKVYYLPFGGTLYGSKGVIITYNLIRDDMAIEIVKNYLDDNSLRLLK